jgi:hypothetical protein
MTIDDTARHSIGDRVGLPADLAAAATLFGKDAELDPAQQAALARMNAVLEVAFLAAAADGEINDAEAENLGATLSGWLGTQLSEDVVEHVIEKFITTLEAEGRETRLAAVAKVLDPDARRVAYTLACLVVLCDLELHDHELDVLGVLATGLDIAQDEAQTRFDEIQGHIEAVVAEARTGS